MTEDRLSPALRVILPTLLLFLFGWAAFYLLPADTWRDQGIFLWQAQTLLDGGVLYRDAWDHKGPLGAVLYALAGGTPLGVHLLDLALLGLTLASLTFLWPHRLEGGLGAFFFYLLFVPHWTISGQPDIWAAEFIVLSLVFFQRPGGASAAVAGVLAGLSVLIKPVYLLTGGVMGFAFLVRASGKEGAPLPRGAEKNFLIFVACFLAPVCVALIWLTEKGALQDMLEAVVFFNLETHVRHQMVPWGSFLTRGSIFPTSGGYDTAVAVVMFLGACRGAWVCVRRSAREGWVVPLLWAATWVVLVVQQKFFSYHYKPHLGIMALLIAVAVADAMHRSTRLAFVPVLTAFSVMAPFVLMSVVLPPFSGFEDQYFNTTALKNVAAEVKARTTPSDRVYLWGFEAGLYPLAERRPPTRYGYVYPLRAGDTTARRAELMLNLTRTPPRLFVVSTQDKNVLLPDDPVEALHAFTELDRFLRTHYSKVWANDRFTLYEAQGPMTKPALSQR